MKTLKEFIIERLSVNESEEATSKKFSFSFKELPNSKETIKSLVDLAINKELEYESTEDSFDITLKSDVCRDSKDKVDAIRDILQQYSNDIRKDSKNASYELFAQLTHKFMDTTNEMVKFIDDASSEEEPSEDKKDDEKKKDDEE